MITTLDELGPAARAAATAFLDDAVAAVEPRLRADLRDDLTVHLCERLDAGSGPSDVERLVAELGALGTPGEDAGRRFVEQLAAGFRLRGLGQRVTASMWNPADDRLFLPRAVGAGWDLNFGAVAVRLGLIEPDAEAVPFAATPDRALAVAALVPAGLAAATVLHYLVRGRSLPDRLPSHWDLAGRPDSWVSKRRAATTDMAVTTLAAAVAGWTAGAARPTPQRVGTIAAATLAATIGATVTVVRSDGDRLGPLATPAMLATSFAAVGGVLLGLARAGRRAEIMSDLRRNDE